MAKSPRKVAPGGPGPGPKVAAKAAPAKKAVAKAAPRK